MKHLPIFVKVLKLYKSETYIIAFSVNYNKNQKVKWRKYLKVSFEEGIF